MAFEKSLLGNPVDDFDPQTAQEELLRQQMGEPLPATLEPRDLNTRLLRKLGRVPLPPQPSPGIITPAKPSTPEQLDFSGFEPAEPVAPQGDTKLDFSGFDDPTAPVPPAADPNKHWAITRGFVSGMLKENPEGLAEALEGVGHLAPGDFKDSLLSASRDVRGVSKLRPEEYAKKSGSMWDIRSIDDALTWAGETLGSGLASTVPSLATGVGGAVVGGRVGGKTGAMVGAGVGATGPSAMLNYGELYKALKDEKVAPEDAAQYAAYATPIMSGLDLASLGPIISRLGGIKEVQSQLARALAKRIAVETAKGAGREGLTEALQEVVKDVTVSLASDKPFWTTETLAGAVESGVGGALVGATMGGASGIKPDKVAPGGGPQPIPPPNAGAIPAPPPGTPPGAAPAGQEEVDAEEFLRRAGGQTRGSAGPAGPAPMRDPATMNDAELIAEFEQARAQMGGVSLEEILRAGGYAPDTIRVMGERAKVEEAIGIARSYKAEAEQKASQSQAQQPEDTSVKPDEMGPQQEGLKPKQPADHREYATLREYGYSDEDIASMPAAQRKREVADAIAEGVKPDEAMKKHQPQATTGGTSSNTTTGTRQAPIRPETADDVKAAQPTAPKSDAQAKAENYKHAHVELPDLGLVGKHSISVETGAGQTRRGTDKNGKPWEVVLKHAYGRIKGTVGADKQPLDIVIGPNPKSPHVFVIDQHEPGEGFDEHKSMAGFDTPQDAIRAYAEMFNDKAEGRIGGMKALTREEFKDWYQGGDTTSPLSASPAAATDSGAGALTEAGAGTSESRPEGEPDRGGAEAGVSEEQTTPITDGSNIPEDIPQTAIDAVEEVLGDLADDVAQVDIVRAAEILAENEGMDPATAFGQAVIDNAVDQGFLTEQEAVQSYGEEVQAILEPEREGAPVSSSDVVETGAASDEVGAGDTKEAGVVSGGSETGAAEDVAAVEAADDQDREQSDAASEQPDAASETGDRADGEAADTAKDADESDGPVAKAKTLAEEAKRRYGTDYNQVMAFKNGANNHDWNLALPIHIKKEEVAEAFEAGRKYGGVTGPTIGEQVEQRKQEAFAKKASQAMEAAIDKIEEAVESKNRASVKKAAKAARKVLADTDQEIKNADAEYWGQFEAQIAEMEKPGYVTAKQKAEAETEASAPDTLETLKKKLQTIASGMSAITDLRAGTYTWGGKKGRGIGVDVGQLTNPAIEQLAKGIIDHKALLFIDSGAFSLFRKNLRNAAAVQKELGDLFGDKSKEYTPDALDFDKIMSKYEEITEKVEEYNAAEETDHPRPLFVMPDVVGDQAESISLAAKYNKDIVAYVDFNIARAIVPIQKGELTLAEAYKAIVEAVGTDKFIVGIPSNEKAVTNDELAAFLKEIKPTRIHFLGSASPKKLEPKLQAIADAGIVIEHLSADANILRSALYGKQAEGTRSEQIIEALTGKDKVEAVGEYLHGARRDKWSKGGLTEDDLAGMDEKDRKANVTKHNIWPKPDYAAAIEQGVEPVAAALIKRIYDRIAVRNATTYVVAGVTHEQMFVKAVNAAREVLSEAETVADVKKASREVAEKLGKDSYSMMHTLYPGNTRDNPLMVFDSDVKAAESAVAAGFPNTAAWHRLFEVRAARKWDTATSTYVPDGFKVYRRNGGFIGNATTREEAEKLAAEAYAKLDEERKKKGDYPDRPHLDKVNRIGPDYRKGKDVTAQDFMDTFGFRGVDFGNWAANDERQTLVNLAFDALHDLARVIGVQPNAISLDGTLGIAFGSRGRGGKGAGAAHYEAGTAVINMTKIRGAGTLAHEWGHALDDYLGSPVGAFGLSGGRVIPKNTLNYWNRNSFLWQKPSLKEKLRQAANKLMHDIYTARESDEAAIKRLAAEKDNALATRARWVTWLKSNPKSHKKGNEAIAWWDRRIAQIEKALEADAFKKIEPSKFYKEAQKISGKGDYWVRPNEMFARSWEAFVYDKLQAEGFESQYLVQGVEENRYGPGFIGNPYPVGEERKTLNADYERLLKAIEATTGKHGKGAKIIASEGLPEPIVIEERVKRPAKEVVDPSKPKTMDEAFAGYFGAGKGFENILAARRFAKESGFEAEPKEIEEAIEFAVVKVARQIIEQSHDPDTAYKALVDLYGRQPRLGTRTSTSVRDQAYSTPVPLAYVASQLAGVNPSSIVYEPTAGNGALLISATPDLTYTNELNPNRRKNLQEQGFRVSGYNASTGESDVPITGADVVITNPPFGSVKEDGETNVYDLRAVLGGLPYQTKQIDHAIAMLALDEMKDDGRAVLILGGVNKLVTGDKARSDVYQNKDKREFYKALYDNYMVSDHFTVSGDLYERQGAGWPVDVVVIKGRGKSSRPLPAVKPPRIYNSWAELEGMVNGQPTESGVRPAGESTPGTAERPAEQLEGDRGGGGRPVASEQPGPEQPARVREQRQPGTAGPRATGGGQPRDTERSGQGDQPGVTGGEPAVDDFDAAFDAALDNAFGPAETASDARGQPIVEQGAVFRTASGRETAPAPAVDSGTDRKANNAIKRLNSWLLDEAKKEVADNSYQSTLLRAIDPNNMSQSDQDTVNLLLFGDPEGPRPSDKVRVEKPARKAAAARSTAKVAKDTAKAAVDAADEAFSALYDLFGGNKTSAFFTFDEDTYRKAKPHFEAAANKFAEFKSNLGELLNRMVAHMRDTLKWGREVMEKIRPYLKQFIADMRAAPAARKEALKAEPTETENQVVYRPRSLATGLDTLAPVNMAKPMADSLDALQQRVGPIDAFVADELGYKRDELSKYFGAEQVDALGLAIDNIKRGKGFIIGDQTGIGKGRVNAAIIRWAIKNDRVPVFVTEKPGLFADMFRDMRDIGISDGFLDGKPRILATNANLKLDLEEGNGAKINTGQPKDHNKLLLSLTENIGSKYDMVFTTYNQMQTMAGEDTARREFLRKLAQRPNGIVIIFDESHNAGGQKERQKKKKADGTAAAEGRSQFSRDLIQKANGVFYSSATYAKRPDVMDLYAATDMAMAVDNISDLAEAIQRGRVPMQQAVASMLAKAGQYMRRERSFAGIDYNTPVVPVDRETYNNICRALAAVQDLSRPVKEATQRLDAEIRAEGEALGYDNATGDAGASSTAFTSSMHNAINQILLAIKADAAADMAIGMIKKGEKPVLTVANTMEAFMKDYADNLDIKPGDEVTADFSDVLVKYLNRTRTVLIKKPFREKGDKPIRHYLTDEELGDHGLAIYDKAMDIIKGMDLSHLPISPIDHIKGRLAKAGYEMGEITGRTLGVDYTGDKPKFYSRSGSERTTQGKNATLKKFNTRPKRGGIHALIINQSGSTGLSAHASVTFDDQSPRRMIIVQAEGNIDTHMQLLGRINRTGQVVLPAYEQLVADVPAEKRPAAVLAKKMASLNANTTASRTSAVTSKDVPDFLNEYGDEVAAGWVRDNPDIHYMMASPVSVSEEGVPKKEDAMRLLTGRIPLLLIDQQEALYSQLEEEYGSLLAQLEAAGENALEAKSLDLKGRLIEYMEVQGKRNESGSPFAAPVVLQKVSIARLGKPYTPTEIMDRLQAAISGDKEAPTRGGNWDIGMLAVELKEFNNPYGIIGKKAFNENLTQRNEATERFKEYKRSVLDDIEKPEDAEKQRVKLDANQHRWVTVQGMLPIGRRVTIKTESGNLTGIVLGVKQSGAPKNPLALGSWKATFAIADASRTMILPFSRLFENGQSNPESALDVEIEPMTDWYETYPATLEKYQHMQSEAREDRWIAGGNILAAYDWLDRKGAIINYTSYKGTVHQGILTARGFDPVKQSIAHGELAHDPAKILAFLNERPGVKLWAKDGNVAIEKHGRYGDDYMVTAQKSKSKGGAYFLDPALTKITGDFSSRGGAMISWLNPNNFGEGVRRMIELGAEFRLPAKRLEPTKVKPREETTPDDDGGPALAKLRTTARGGLDMTPEERAVIEKAVRDAVARMIGDNATVELFNEPFPMPASAAAAWGDVASDTAEGLYRPWQNLIQLALTPDILKNLTHEAFHAIEFKLMTPQERALMERETPRLRAMLRQNNENGLTPEQVDGLADFEVRAIAFEMYADGRANGAMHIGVRRWYQKLADMLRRLANALRGLGYRTYEDIFGQAYDGAYRNARPDTPAPGMMGPGPSFAAVRPGGARPGPQPQNETIGEQLMDRGHQKLARLANRLGIGRFNTTEARTLIQDKAIRIKRMEESVGGVPSNLSAYQAESLYYGRTGERLERLEENSIDPLIEAMHAADISPGELNAYLYARHAQERNEHIDTINPNLGGEGSGMSTADADAILNGIPAAKQADYDRLAGMVDQIIADTRDTLVAYGLISQETADAWANQYRFYVPLRGWAEGMEDEASFGTGRGYDTRAKITQTAFGRSSEADGPLHYIIQQAQSAIVRGEKNRVGNFFLRFVRANPDPDRWQVNAPTIKRRIDPRTGLVTHYADFNYYNDKDAFVTRVGGVPQVIRLYGKDGLNIARAFKAMGTTTMHPVIQVLHTLTTLQSRLATQWNPNFTLANLTRDLGEAFINMQEQDQQRFMRQFVSHLPHTMKGVFRALTNPSASDPYVDAFREFDRSGGRIHFFGLSDPDDIKRSLNRSMRRMEGGAFNSVMNAAEAVGKAFDIMNSTVENATRLAAYMAARDVGMSVPDSSFLARNLTVDFNKGGEWRQAINALYMFGGASIQGIARMGRALTNARVRKACYTLVAMGAVGALYNLLAGGDDDDGEAYYSKIKPYIRDKNIIIMMPKGFGLDGKYMKIPLPYGFAPFHVIGDRAVGVALGKDKVGESAAAVLGSVAESFNPTGQESSLWMHLVPSLLRPGLHIANNKNWTGNPLYPENDYNKHRPDSEKAFPSTSSFSKWAAKAMNEATGGSAYKAGWVDVHPGTLDKVLQTITGGLGGFVMDVAKTGVAAVKDGTFDATKAPIIKRFLGSAKDPETDAQAYYEARDKARSGGENLRAARKDLTSGRNREEAESFIRDNPKALKADAIFKAADEQMKPLRARRQRIEESEALTGEQRRRELDAITEQMRKIQNAARKRYRELKEGKPQ